jgi:hypothetical protein
VSNISNVYFSSPRALLLLLLHLPRSNELKIYRREGPHKGLTTLSLSTEPHSLTPTDAVPIRHQPEDAHVARIGEAVAERFLHRFGRNHNSPIVSGPSRPSSANADEPVRTEGKVLHCAWHPHDASLAVVGQGGLCFYHL